MVLAFLLPSVTFPVPLPSSITAKRTLVSSLVGGMAVGTERSLNFKVLVLTDMKGRKLAMILQVK